MCTVIFFPFMLNFSPSGLLRSNLFFPILRKSCAGLYISPNSPWVQTIWIPHVEETFLSENWSDPKQTKQYRQGLQREREGQSPESGGQALGCRFSGQLPIDSRMYMCTLRSVYPACILAYDINRPNLTPEKAILNPLPLLLWGGRKSCSLNLHHCPSWGGSAYGVISRCMQAFLLPLVMSLK